MPDSKTSITVNSVELREQLEQLLDQVSRDEIRLTVEEDGKPIAVLISAQADERQRARRRFLERVEMIQRRANVSPEEAEILAREAVESVRKNSA